MILVYVCLAFLLATVGLLVTGDYRLVVMLRRDWPAVWQSLGRPSPLFTRFEDVAAVQQFLFQRKYREIGDPSLARFAERLRTLTMVAYTAAAIALIVATAARIGRR